MSDLLDRKTGGFGRPIRISYDKAMVLETMNPGAEGKDQ